VATVTARYGSWFGAVGSVGGTPRESSADRPGRLQPAPEGTKLTDRPGLAFGAEANVGITFRLDVRPPSELHSEGLTAIDPLMSVMGESIRPTWWRPRSPT
jgi:hypothetical protein